MNSFGKHRHEMYELRAVIREGLSNLSDLEIDKSMRDRKHKIIVIRNKQNKKVIGGCVFKIFQNRGFAELTFFCIDEAY